jgi:hypothetical protein
VVATNAGWYSCAVTDTLGTVFSTQAVLGIKPYLLVPPTPQTIANGAPISVSAVIQGYPPPYLFQWRRGNATIGIETSSLSATTFMTFNSALTGFTNSLGSFSNAFNLRLLVTNLATAGIAETLSNFPAWGPGVNNIIVLADADGDGIPNQIENAWGLMTNNAADGPGDLDGDGMSNLAEYLAGTDATDRASYLKVEPLRVAPESNLLARIEFNAVSNRTYTVLSSPAVTPPNWTRFADVPATTTTRAVVLFDPQPAVAPMRIYRLVTPRMP